MQKVKTLKVTKFLTYLLVGAFLFYLNALEISFSQSPSPESFVKEGKELYKRGKYEESLKKLEQAEFYFKTIEHKTKAERLAEIYFYQGLNFIKQGNEKIAKEMFKRVLYYAPDRDYEAMIVDEVTKEIFTSAKVEFEEEYTPEAMGKSGDNGGSSGAVLAVLAVLALAAVGVLAYLLLKGKEEEKEEAPPEPDVGSIQVNSTPTGATIYLDGQNTGQKTNATLTNVSVGSHTVKLVKERYQDWETTVNVQKNQTATVDATLKPGSFTENFNDGKADFWKNPSKYANWYVEGGVYKVKSPHREFPRAYYSLAKFENNWTYEVKIKRFIGRAYHVLGPGFAGSDNFNVYYAFDISPGYQMWSVWKVDETTTHKEWEIVPWTTDKIINKTGWNTCKIVANGKNFTFYINGKMVKSVNISGVPSKGYIGLWTYAYAPANVAGYDNIKFSYGVTTGSVRGETVIPKLVKPGESSMIIK